ncbi:MAG: SAM-dependent methyltransferase, partial [Dehalococcoidia bacterium]|nr:SAM-dependent methyltransferase [Dehalococcoidia bacterium]
PLPFLLAGILSSAIAMWYLLMTGSAFGLWRRQVKEADIVGLPVPDLRKASESESGKHIVQLVRSIHDCGNPVEQETLDELVCDLYGLESSERIVVQDGQRRASWQWVAARKRSTDPASLSDRKRYARAFLSRMDTWMKVSNRRRMCAEVYDLAPDAPIGVVRFEVEDTHGPPEVKVVRTDAALRAVLRKIGERARVRIARELVGVRELRVHSENEVSIIKPAGLRHWLGVCGLEDADAVLRDSIRGSDAR